jgi:hypothetical protein
MGKGAAGEQDVEQQVGLPRDAPASVTSEGVG